MFLALDARTVYRPQRRGTGKNLLDLYRHLALARPDWRVLAFHREGRPEAGLLPAEQVEPRRIEMPGDRFEAWERWRLPAAAWRAGVELLHCPANTCPAWMPVPTVVTIHDLIPLDMPQGRPAAQVSRFEHCVATACEQAAGIITPSFYTRRRLIQQYGADPDRVSVNFWAADSSVGKLPQETWEPVARKYGVDRPMILHLGAADPRKNTAGVIEAWARVPEAIRRRWTLLVVGLDSGTLKEMTSYASFRGVMQDVRLHGFAPEADLPALFNAAEILAFPSLSEGFGLPILDAWSTDTAVLTSNTTSLPEVAADGALLVDPYDTDAVAQGLVRLMEDTTTRVTCVERGRKRLRSFTWQNTVGRFVRAMESAAGMHLALRHAA
ncbi:MAG: glycosyltransferase family 1 protein [Planctomycetota bacterium]|nr:glycosyltransferase family 1 protein [Planctomycetota bacterium]